MKNSEIKHFINIDEAKCVGCKKCIVDCPMDKIILGENRKAKMISQECIKCGHCTAICPTEAISMTGYEESCYNLNQLKQVDSDALLDTIKKRRTIRQFQEKKVTEEDFNKIIDAGRWTARGKNNQNVRYILIEEKRVDIEKIAVSVFRKLVKILGLFNSDYKNFEINDSFFFKNAPLIISIVSDDMIDAALVSGNMTIVAESLGLGVLNSGFFSFAIKISRKIRKILAIKRNESVITLVIGHPSVKYMRTTQKDKATIVRK